MSEHKVMVNGNVHNISYGECRIDGISYKINYGKTRIYEGGTSYTKYINFGKKEMQAWIIPLQKYISPTFTRFYIPETGHYAMVLIGGGGGGARYSAYYQGGCTGATGATIIRDLYIPKDEEFLLYATSGKGIGGTNTGSAGGYIQTWIQRSYLDPSFPREKIGVSSAYGGGAKYDDYGYIGIPPKQFYLNSNMEDITSQMSPYFSNISASSYGRPEYSHFPWYFNITYLSQVIKCDSNELINALQKEDNNILGEDLRDPSQIVIKKYGYGGESGHDTMTKGGDGGDPVAIILKLD